MVFKKINISIGIALFIICFLFVYFLKEINIQLQQNKHTNISRIQSSESLTPFGDTGGISVPIDQSISSTEKMLLDLIPYQNDSLDVSFDYPRDYKGTRCDIAIRQEDEESKGSIGSKIEISITPYSESVLHINHLVSSTLHDIQIATQKYMTIDGEQSLQIGYRFGGMNRYGEITYIIHAARLYTFGFTSGEFECGFEPMVYEKLLETVKFD